MNHTIPSNRVALNSADILGNYQRFKSAKWVIESEFVYLGMQTTALQYVAFQGPLKRYLCIKCNLPSTFLV